MSIFRRFLSRRYLLTFLGVAALLFGITMLHPYPRQSLFGPTIRGKPWCYWEDQVRRHATHRREEAKRSALEKKIRAWLGMDRDELIAGWYFNDEEMLPLFLKLTADDDKDVQSLATAAILSFENLHQEPALPILREQLHDNDPISRIYAAKGVWRITKDKQVIPTVVQVLNTPTKGTYHRRAAIEVLSYIARDLPELFPDVVALASHEEESLRAAAMSQMWHFGKQGTPILLNGLDDRHEWVRVEAARSLGRMGAEALVAVPALQRLLLDENLNLRGAAIDALVAIDRQRFINLKYPPDG